MALPLLFFIGSSIVRAATPTIARLLVKQGYKRASSAVVKNTLKTAKKIRTIGKKKDIPIAKNKSLTVPKNQSTALTKIDKVAGGGKSSNVGAKVIGGGATVISGAAALSTDKKKGDAKADSNKKKQKVSTAKKRLSPGALGGKVKTLSPGALGGKVKKSSTSSTMKTKGSDKVGGGPKVIVTKEQLEKSGLSLRDYMNMLESKRLGRKISRDPKNDKKTVKKSEKKVEKKTPNYAGSQSIPKKKTPNYAGSQSIPKKAEKKKEEPKKSKSFLDRVKEDFSKAVKETKRNFSGDFKKGTGRYKSISTGKTNFNKKKKKAS